MELRLSLSAEYSSNLVEIVSVRICHFSSVHRTNDVRIAVKQANSLCEAGFDVHIIGRNAAPISREISTHSFLDCDNRILRSVRAIRFGLKRISAISPQLVHLHDPELLPLIPLLKLRGLLVIYDAHENYYKSFLDRSYVPHYLRWLPAISMRVLESFFSSFADAVILVDESGMRWFKNREIAIIKNSPLTLRNHSEIDIPDSKSLIAFYAGSISRKRGLEEMLHIAHTFPQLKLELAGPCASTHIEKQLQSDKFPNLRYHGILSHSDTLSVMRRADLAFCLLQPTAAYENAQATKVFEYLAAGVPVIYSNTEGHRQLLKFYGGGVVVDYGDRSALTAAVQALMRDNVRAALRQEAMSAADKLPNWQTEERTLLDLYARVLRT